MAEPIESVKIYDISGAEPVLGSIHPSEVDQALASGNYSLPKGQPVDVVSPEGELGTIDPAEATNAIQAGFKFATPDLQKEIKFGTTEQQIKAGLEGFAEGVAGPIAPFIEKSLGVKPENIRGRAEINPGTHMAGQIAGLGAGILTGTGEAAVLEAGGKAAAEALGLGLKGAGALNQIGAHSVRAATEMGILASGDEVSKIILEDPNQSLESAIANVGLSSLIGGGAGAVIGSIAPLWKATAGDRAAQFVEDFKGRINQHMANPDPLAALTDELGTFHKNITGLADDVYGASGLKAQEIEKIVPKRSEGMVGQATEIFQKFGTKLDEMKARPDLYPPRLVNRLEGDFARFAEGVNNKESLEMFNAIQDLKQTLQGYSKFEKFVKPVDEAYDFVRASKELGHDVRAALENKEIWGAAAERQQAINKAFKDYLPALQDFEKKFTIEVAGERVIDPGKVSTYFNQLGKPNAEIKQQVLENFIKASEKYKNVINETHANLGIPSPFTASSLNQAHLTLEKLSPGAKAADIMIKKGLANVAGSSIGAAIGGAAGHAAGAGWIGALIGEHALGPFFSSVLPSIFKPLMDRAASGEGFKAVAEYGAAIAKGNTMIQKASRALFKPGAEVSTQKLLVSDRDRERLDKRLKELNADQSKLFEVGGHASYYMPNHAMSMGETSARVTQYLNSLRPQVEKTSPLDSDLKPSKVQTAAYNRALDIAEKPLIVMQAVKDGTVTPQDVTHLKTMYPALYVKLATNIHQEIAEKVGKGENIPYKMRLSLSLFLGEPLDSTLTPQSIQSIQMMAAPQMPVQPPAMPKNKGSLKSLNKMPSMYQTPGQARVAEKTTD